MSAPQITTARLELTPLLEDDAETLYEYLSDPEVGRYQGFEPESVEEALEFIEGVHAHPFGTAGHWFQLGMRLRESGLLIGDMGIHLLASDPRQAEVGITLARSHQGIGYATEAMEGVLAYLFGPLELHRVMASVDPRNGASIALLGRVGMRLEAHFLQSLWFKGEWVDDMVFGMLASEWKDRPRAWEPSSP